MPKGYSRNFLVTDKKNKVRSIQSAIWLSGSKWCYEFMAEGECYGGEGIDSSFKAEDMAFAKMKKVFNP